MSRSHTVYLAAAFACGLLLCGESGFASPPEKPLSSGVENLDVEQASQLLEQDASIVVLDVRTPGEFAAGHLADAMSIDVDDPGFRERASKLQRDRPYLVHCAAGIPQGRSRRSVAVLQELGFTRIYHLDGGINAWKASGKAVRKSPSEG